jgi:hypothetical protein
MTEPTTEQFIAAVRAFHEVEKDLEVNWVAHKPIQGEATAKVFAYRIATAVLSLTVSPSAVEALGQDGSPGKTSGLS